MTPPVIGRTVYHGGDEAWSSLSGLGSSDAVREIKQTKN
jgi:hypothetical protein